MELEIDISKRNFFIIISALFIFSGIIFVNAYNTRWNELPGNPEFAGHSPDEIQVHWSKILNMPTGFSDGSDAGAGACSSGQIRVGSSCKTIPSCSSSQVTRWSGSSFSCITNPPPPPPPPTYSWKYFAKYNPDYICSLPFSGSGVISYTESHVKMASEPTGYPQGDHLECAREGFGCLIRAGDSSPNGNSCSASQEGKVCIAGSYSGTTRGVSYFSGSKNKYKCTKD